MTAQDTLFAVAPRTGGGRVLVLSDQPLSAARARLVASSPEPQLITPNLRAARALHAAAGTAASLADLAIKRLEAAGWSEASTVSQLLTLRRAAAESSALSARAASTGALGSAVRELLRAGLGGSDVVAATIMATEGISARTKALVDVTRRYRDLLADGHQFDPADALWRAVGAAPRHAPEPVLVAGYPRVGLAELAFLDAVAAEGSAFVLPIGFEASKEAAAVLAERGWLVAEETAVESATSRPGATAESHLGVGLARTFTANFDASVARVEQPDRGLTASRHATQEDEVRFVLAKVKELLEDGVSHSELTLIARDEHLYGPLVEAVAWEFDVPVKLSYTVPVRSTRLGGMLAGVAAASGEGFAFEPTARLFAHPLWRALDGERWRAARLSHPSGLDEWTAITGAATLLDWPQHATMETYRARLEQLLDGAGVTPRLSEREARAMSLLNAAFDEFDKRTSFTRDDFLSLLEELLAVLSVGVDAPSKRGVEFHTPLAVFGASYEHVFVLGAVEGVLPAPLSDDPLLDFFERDLIRPLGLPLENAVGASERESLSFLAALLTARTSLTMTYPELLGNREQLASPFFAALGAVPSTTEPRLAASGPEQLLLTLRTSDGPARHAWEVEARRESDAPPDVFDGVTGVPVEVSSRRFSASQLATLGQCAFRWHAQRRLHLAEPEEAEDEISPMLLGSIYHKALELVTKWAWEGLSVADAAAVSTTPRGWDEAAADAFREAAVAHLDAAFTQAQAEVGAPTAASWPLQRREHLGKLSRVIRAADFLLPETEVVKLEGSFAGNWRGFEVTGYVDRVDDGPRGLVLTDYKTGKAKPVGAKNSRGEPKLDLQLPLYVETAAPAWFPDGRAVHTARYFSINGATTISESNIDDAELQQFVARAMEVLRKGDFPVDPDEEQKVCTYCEFDALCRRGPRLGRMRQRAEREAAATAESR